MTIPQPDRTKYQAALDTLCQEYFKYNSFDPELYTTFDVKRGLRNADGTGVVAGITQICNVHGYVLNEGERDPIDGQLVYRGYDIHDIVEDCNKTNRFGYEETAYLLLLGKLPNKQELKAFKNMLSWLRDLPDGFVENVILNIPSKNVMNKMASSILALYTYDDYADDTSIEQELRKAFEIMAKMPTIMISAYHAKRKNFDNQSLVLHPLRFEESIAESILSTLRYDRKYTPEEARLLDLMLILHAEHGGGNNSTFTCRTLTSSGTDAYSAYAAAIGSLKGPRHGGANAKVMEMIRSIEAGVRDWEDEEEVAQFLRKIIRKQAGDRSGLIYGMGHAVYTKSDPRAVILKQHAMRLASGTSYEARFKLLNLVEKLTPVVFAEERHVRRAMCANVDLYSGLVYRMLDIPDELVTPLFATSRMAGWCAHRLEEILSGGKIIRPAYKTIMKTTQYIPLNER